jgi:aldehyde dehydrogenase (NAD+)
MRIHETFFIGGEQVRPAGTGVLEVRSPATEELIGRAPEGSPADIDRAVAAAREAFDEGPWPRLSPAERADALARLNEQLMARQEELAQVITAEVGSPITFSRTAQALAPSMVLSYFEGLTRSYAFDELREGAISKVWVLREPVGVVAAIIPWNVPLFVAVLKLAPALAAGCTVVLKPAPETPLFAYLLAEAIVAAELPKGVVNIVTAGREVGEHLVRHPGVDKVSFTGSTAAGRRIGALCGELLRPVTLELGGKSAAIFLDDASFEQRVPELLPFALMNSGQACIAQTRVLVSKRRYAEMVEVLTAAVRQEKLGDPFDDDTSVGPLIAERQRARVEGFIERGLAEGARITTGGGRPKGFSRGHYVEPTVFCDVKNEMTIAQEEIFGPVLVVIPYEDEADAVRLANASRYGLAGSVWTEDHARGLSIARRVRTGTSCVNGYVLDFAAPFGGYKESGLGRELGPEGLAAFLELKSVSMPFDYQPPDEGASR